MQAVLSDPKRRSQMALVFCLLTLLIYVLYTNKPSTSMMHARPPGLRASGGDGGAYSLTQRSAGGKGPLRTVWGESTLNEYKLAIVSDLDQMSAIPGGKPAWKSLFKRGTLKRFVEDKGGESYSIEWEPDVTIVGALGEEGRGMELSELVTWQGALLAWDDRTGVGFEITPDLRAIPRHILMEGDGERSKGHKNEWSTVKDDLLYVGSFGKEYVNSDGSIKNRWNLFVKTIDAHGKITHHDWTDKYEVLRKATGASWPGYMIHEAIHFDDYNRKWVVLPRRVSDKMYDEKTDEVKGSNLVLVLDEDFTRVERQFPVGPAIPLRGWSSFKFLPQSKGNVIVALKTEEEEDKRTGKSLQRTFITVFRLSDGVQLMEQVAIPGAAKYEGLEFL